LLAGVFRRVVLAGVFSAMTVVFLGELDFAWATLFFSAYIKLITSGSSLGTAVTISSPSTLA